MYHHFDSVLFIHRCCLASYLQVITVGRNRRVRVSAFQLCTKTLLVRDRNSLSVLVITSRDIIWHEYTRSHLQTQTNLQHWAPLYTNVKRAGTLLRGCTHRFELSGEPSGTRHNTQLTPPNHSPSRNSNRITTFRLN